MIVARELSCIYIYIILFHSRHSEASNLHGRAGGSCPEADHYSCCCSLAPQKGLHEHGPKNAKAHDMYIIYTIIIL